MANKKVKGARANKPNDSFGTINNNDLYKNSQYSKDLDKDDEEVEQSEEENTGPVEETATQEKESSESFAAKKEEVDYKKRYDDLKRHYDQKIEEFKKSSAKVESEKQTLKATGNLEAFRSKYPDVYEAVEQLSSAKADSQIASLKEEIDSLKGNEKNLKKEKAYEELLRLQPEFDKLKADNKFLKWLETQPKSISSGIYDNGTDAKWASRVVDLYKADTGKPKRSVSRGEDAAVSVKSPQVREVRSTDEKGNRIWKASEIERLKPWEFEKFEKEIDKARSEGRLDLSS